MNVTANLSVTATFVEALGPISSNLVANAVAMNTTGLLTATVSDVLTGNSNVASAQFRVDGVAMRTALTVQPYMTTRTASLIRTLMPVPILVAVASRSKPSSRQSDYPRR